MYKMVKYIILFALQGLILSVPSCTTGKNFCKKCNILTNLCFQCHNQEILIPDENGGCSGAKICKIGANYCEKCDEKNSLCNTCEEGYFPDENGACSFTDNCELSYLGQCLRCKNDFILILNSRICKSLNSKDFLNCEEIDMSTGYCKTCKEGYYLNIEDKKCSDTDHCDKSMFGRCISCNRAYYLDIQDKNKCKYQYDNKIFLHCKETEDGENCSKCDEDYYFDEEGKCVSTEFCSKSNDFTCLSCLPNYYFSLYGNICLTTDNCLFGEGYSGICSSCLTHFYFDANDGQCKSNQRDDDLKYCSYFTDKCISCDGNYKLGEDWKCSNITNCAESEYGICNKCTEGNYLDLYHQCTNIEHCKYSNYYYGSCDECEDRYYFDILNGQCQKAEGNFTNCKISDENSTVCDECKNDYYLSGKDNKCYSNEDEDHFYKCGKTNINDTECIKCTNNYYLGEDKKCSTIENCGISEKGECILCEEEYCLDVKNKVCNYNFYVEEKDKKFYRKCVKTNEEGTACKICEEGYNLTDTGLCVNSTACEVEKDDVCVKCKEGISGFYSYCLNSDLGCVENYVEGNCFRCDDVLDFDNCTECKEGYKLVESDYVGEFACIPIEE